MHHKFCVIDHSSAGGIVITGSMNWSYTVSYFQLFNFKIFFQKQIDGFVQFQAFKQCENVLFISSVPIQEQYEAAFTDIWYQTISSNTSAGNNMAPITAYNNNPTDQRNLWATARRPWQIGYTNGGY